MKAKLLIDVTVIADGGGFSTVIHSLPNGAFSVKSSELSPEPVPFALPPEQPIEEPAPKKKGKK